MFSFLFGRRQQTRSERPNLTMSFNDLPAEIRNMIYQFTLIHDDEINLSPESSLSKAIIKPNILATCRRIRDEATPIFYGHNTFALPTIKATERFFHQLRPQSVASIRTIRLFAGFQLAVPSWMRDAHMKARLEMINEMIKKCDCLNPEALVIPALVKDEIEQWVKLKDVVLETKEQAEKPAPEVDDQDRKKED